MTSSTANVGYICEKHGPIPSPYCQKCEAGKMKAPTQQQLNDPAWWDENAPDCATHYSPNRKEFVIAGEGWAYGIDNKYKSLERLVYPKQPERIPRPKAPEAEWVDGFPPVGCECEVRYPIAWVKAKSLHVTQSGICVCETVEGDVFHSQNPEKFRPIRTKEQRNRDALADLCRTKFNQHTSSSNSHLWQQIADAIIAAGWRKGDS